MSLATTATRAYQGINAEPVVVEAHIGAGLPSFTIVGLPEAALRESRDRVRAAIQNSQFDFPLGKITVNLAPADLPKTGGYYDLSIAVGILVASGQVNVSQADLAQFEFIGELALSGELRAVKGVLPAALAARSAKKALFLPQESLAEVAFLEGLVVFAAGHLLDVCAHLSGASAIPAAELAPHVSKPPAYNGDLCEVRGQQHAKRALEIAAAGGHNLLMVGPPGTGKTLLASRLITILPPMREAEAIETAAIYSVSHQGFSFDNWCQRPYRAPHHTVSAVALVGGGSNPQPGEISLAHHGVLFLDELTEFSRQSLEVLREPLERGEVTISRAARQAQFPAQFQLVAAMNPCPCGFLGDPQKRCGCTPDQIARYNQKISGPLLDRIDLHLNVPRLSHRELTNQDEQAPNSAQVRARTSAAFELQMSRQGCSNAKLSNQSLERFCVVDEPCQKLLAAAVERLNLSPRAYHRVLKVARTIADLNQNPAITTADLSEALGYRPKS